jgi:hypothetical protein
MHIRRKEETMKRSDALSLTLKEVFDPEFVREVIDRKGLRESTSPRGALLCSQTSATIVCNRILETFTAEDEHRRLDSLASLTTSEVRCMAKLGRKTTRWLEEYLHLIGVNLPCTSSIHGMSPEAQGFLRSLG